jgi:protein-S-isoprenylcysteine O-methyltransferase Ste14
MMQKSNFFRKHRGIFKKMDFERLFMISICTFFVTNNIYTIVVMIESFAPISSFKILKFSHQTLLLSFNGLIIFLYFVRHRAQSTCKSLFANSIAFLGTCLPLLLGFLSKPETINPVAVLLGDFLIGCGIAFSIYSLSHLGKNFSVIPQARKLVQNGPYKIVRHPLYIGELMSSFGVVLVTITFSRMLFFFCLVLCQVYRAYQEEKILANVFPEYQSYQSKTARFIPGIF